MIKKKYASLLVVLFYVSNLNAQIVINEPPKMLYYEFAAKRITKFKDMKNFRDVFHVNKYLLGRNRISGNISYNTGRVLINDGKEMHAVYRSAMGFYTRLRFLEEFSFNSTFYWDFNKQAAARWISDYSYAIGRYNWRPKVWNYGYENYINNKYTDNLETMGQKFLEGYYFLSYQHNLSDKLTKAIAIDASTTVKFIYFTRYAIKYRDEFEVRHGGLTSGKSTTGIAMRYTILWNIYVEGALYYYANPVQRQPWDPDYTYGFGYFRWESFRFSITYGNWAINHFSWNKSIYPNYGFLDGQFRFVFNWVW